MVHPKDFIKEVTDIFGQYPKFSGGCMKFHLLLKHLYPQAKGYYNNDHVITEIDSKYYDQTGEVRRTRDYLPFEVFGIRWLEQHFDVNL